MLTVELDAVGINHRSFGHQTVIGATGAVAFHSSASTITFSCSFDVSKFPYDSQTCLLKFGQWVSSQEEYRVGKINPLR